MKIHSKGLILLTALSTAACGDLFTVDNVTNIIDPDLDNPQMITALGNSSEAAFAEAFNPTLISVALFSDEGMHVSTQTDALNMQAGVRDGWNLWYEDTYNELSGARWVADEMVSRIGELVDNDNANPWIARGYFWGGLSLVFLADLFEEVTLDGGAPISQEQAYQEALTRLERAATVAGAANERELQAAALGVTARVHRSLSYEGGGGAAALARAADYATQALAAHATYHQDAHYEQPGSSLTIHNRYTEGFWDRIDPRYANQIDSVSGVREPRIKHGPRITAAADGRDVYLEQKYGSYSADVPVSKWQEAHLIIAEHAHSIGDLPTAVQHINAVRAGASLQPFASSDADEIARQIRYERIVEFWLEGRRWQDMRYAGEIPPDWSNEEKARGLDLRWPISDLERSVNPNVN